MFIKQILIKKKKKKRLNKWVQCKRVYGPGVCHVSVCSPTPDHTCHRKHAVGFACLLCGRRTLLSILYSPFSLSTINRLLICMCHLLLIFSFIIKWHQYRSNFAWKRFYRFLTGIILLIYIDSVYHYGQGYPVGHCRSGPKSWAGPT